MIRFYSFQLTVMVCCVRLVAADATDSSAIMSARKLVQADVAPKVPGFEIAVAVDDKIVWSEAFGYADLAGNILVTPATRFRIGSASKTLTSIGLALLVERGLVDLDAPIQKYVPDFPEKGAVITTRLLAGHLSGIRNYRGIEALSDRPFVDLHSGLRIFEDDPLETPPGTRFGYSSFNWNLIGVVMERTSKQEFLQYMEGNVIVPLGMRNTRPDRTGVADSMRAQFYEVDANGSFVIAPMVDSSYKWPSGGYLSTAEDMARCGSAVLKPGFLKSESLQFLFISQRTNSGKITHYGAGWFVGRTILYHGGDSVGGTSVLLLRPSSKTVVAIAANRGHLTIGRASNSFSPANAADHYSSEMLVKEAHKIALMFAQDNGNSPSQE